MATEPGWPDGFSFDVFDQLVSRALPGHVRMRLFYALPRSWQDQAWRSLRNETHRARHGETA